MILFSSSAISVLIRARCPSYSGILLSLFFKLLISSKTSVRSVLSGIDDATRFKSPFNKVNSSKYGSTLDSSISISSSIIFSTTTLSSPKSSFG